MWIETSWRLRSPLNSHSSASPYFCSAPPYFAFFCELFAAHTGHILNFISSLSFLPLITRSLTARPVLAQNHRQQHPSEQSRPWLQNLVFTGQPHGLDQFYRDVHLQSAPSLRTNPSSAVSPDQADSPLSSASSSVPSQHAGRRIISGISATRPSPHSVTGHNHESIELSSSDRRNSRRAAESAEAFLPTFLDGGDGCGAGEQLQGVGVALQEDEL